MEKSIFFIHTVNGLVDMFSNLCRELIPGSKICHISDESLIQGVLAAGGLTPVIYRRVCEHAVAAEQSGADVIQLTCSSISPCADVARHLVNKPLLKVDEPMVEQAVSHYQRIGIIATAPTTLKPSTDLVREKALAKKGSIKIESVLCRGAFDAFLANNLNEHDKIVRSYLLDLMKKVDVVLLAQASMMRIANALEEKEKRVPVLSSPRLAVERLAKVLAFER
jgi:Asp/Glu/hydantoin racemase